MVMSKIKVALMSMGMEKCGIVMMVMTGHL
jgi:hypothetical protein